MSQETLYHFFPRKFETVEQTLIILKSIVNNGLYLTREVINVPWRDYYGKNKNRELKIEQYRFCLTAISNKDELINHSKLFGFIGIGFDSKFITQLGGFPVFYVPSPQLDTFKIEDYKGISLLYRIAEVQEILEFIVKNKMLESKDIDIENSLGAIRMLANICYPTNPKVGSNMCKSNYYNQREWRIIYGLTPSSVSVKGHTDFYSIKTFDNNLISNFIKKIVVCKHGCSENQIDEIIERIHIYFKKNNKSIEIEIIE